MANAVRQCLLIIFAFAFVSAGAAGRTSMTTAAAEPCHHGDGHGIPHEQHRGVDSAICLGCCVGLCANVPDQPPHALRWRPAHSVTTAAYWAANATLRGRSFPPDPAPPRTTL